VSIRFPENRGLRKLSRVFLAFFRSQYGPALIGFCNPQIREGMCEVVVVEACSVVPRPPLFIGRTGSGNLSLDGFNC
jgi:hypothetical protein